MDLKRKYDIFPTVKACSILLQFCYLAYKLNNHNDCHSGEKRVVIREAFVILFLISITTSVLDDLD